MKNQTHEPDCACCRLGPEGAKKLEQDLRERYGHIVIGVHDHPPFAYSVGLWNNNLPELIIMGMDGRQSTMSINLVAAWMEAERIIPEHGSIHDSPFRLPTKFLRVAEREIEQRMVKTKPAERELSQHPYALQIVWPDREGRFPGDPDFSREFQGRQLLLV